MTLVEPVVAGKGQKCVDVCAEPYKNGNACVQVCPAFLSVDGVNCASSCAGYYQLSATCVSTCASSSLFVNEANVSCTSTCSLAVVKLTAGSYNKSPKV